MAGTFTNLLYHLVFSTKDRAPLLTVKLRDRLYPYIGGIIRGEEGTLLEIGGMPDHVHLLARFQADSSIATMTRLIKGNSSKWINETREGGTGTGGRFRWQAGYGAFSVSESHVPAVRRYIQGQQRHHASLSFEEELIALLDKHGIKYDERFLLG